MGASTRLNSLDSLSRESMMPGEKLSVFLGEDVIRDRGNVSRITQPKTQLKHQGGLAASNRATNTHGERPLGEIPIERLIAIMKMSRVIQMFVGVAVGSVRVGMRLEIRTRIRMGMCRSRLTHRVRSFSSIGNSTSPE